MGIEYEIGFRAAWLRMFAECVKVLGPDGSAESWRLEREETIVALRLLCEDFALSQEWDNQLHLADIIEKHIRRSLDGTRDADHCTPEERAVIEAAVSFIEIAYVPGINAGELRDAVSVLLTARAKKREGFEFVSDGHVHGTVGIKTSEKEDEKC